MLSVRLSLSDSVCLCLFLSVSVCLRLSLCRLCQSLSVSVSLKSKIVGSHSACIACRTLWIVRVCMPTLAHHQRTSLQHVLKSFYWFFCFGMLSSRTTAYVTKNGSSMLKVSEVGIVIDFAFNNCRLPIFVGAGTHVREHVCMYVWCRVATPQAPPTHPPW